MKKKKETKTPIKPSTTKENVLDKRVANNPKDDKTFYDMHYGRLPWPTMNIPEDIRKEMRKKCTVEHKEYMLKKVSIYALFYYISAHGELAKTYRCRSKIDTQDNYVPLHFGG